MYMLLNFSMTLMQLAMNNNYNNDNNNNRPAAVLWEINSRCWKQLIQCNTTSSQSINHMQCDQWSMNDPNSASQNTTLIWFSSKHKHSLHSNGSKRTEYIQWYGTICITWWQHQPPNQKRLKWPSCFAAARIWLLKFKDSTCQSSKSADTWTYVHRGLVYVDPFSTWHLHVAWMYIWWVCTRAARKENPNTAFV